jgi:hypothetical protein
MVLHHRSKCFKIAYIVLFLLLISCLTMFSACELVEPRLDSHEAVDQSLDSGNRTPFSVDEGLVDTGTVDLGHDDFTLTDHGRLDHSLADSTVLEMDMLPVDMNSYQPDMLDTDMSDMLSDFEVFDSALPDADLPDSDLPDPNIDEPKWIRAPCFLNIQTDSELDPLPLHCVDLFERAPHLQSGCYAMRQADGLIDQGYCWRQKALALLVNNEIETEPHNEDSDQDGIIDQGEHEGSNYPADPFNLSPLEMAQRLQREVRTYFREITYGALWIDLEVHWANGGYDQRNPQPSDEVLSTEQWLRLRALRPGFANEDLMRSVCEAKGGMTANQWRSYSFIMTIISHGTSTSGSQYRIEDLPVGAGCDDTISRRGDYIVMKRFRWWNRLGTMFHEIVHTLSRDPLPEPSIGHSESTHAVTGENAEYGDLTDLMGSSSDRGHLSAPQKAFLRYLPLNLGSHVSLDQDEGRFTLSPLEPAQYEDNEKRLLSIEVERGMTYYVEVRRAIGEDQNIDSIFHQGALIKRARNIDRANKSYIIDPTPETATDQSTDSVLLPNRTFSDLDNQIHITLLESLDNQVDVVVKRGESSRQPPTIDSVDIEQTEEDGAVTYQITAQAHSEESTVTDEDLLYFWKLNPIREPYLATSFRIGPSIELTNPTTESIWLLVSDQKGGTTWQQVNLNQTITEPVCGNFIIESGEECDEGPNQSEYCEWGEEQCSVCGADCTLQAGQICPQLVEDNTSPLGPNCTDTCQCISDYTFGENRANNGVCEVYVFPEFEENCCAYGTDCTDCQGRGQPRIQAPCHFGTEGPGSQGIAAGTACTAACCSGVKWRHPLNHAFIAGDQRPKICDWCHWLLEEDDCGRITSYQIRYELPDDHPTAQNCSQRSLNADERRFQWNYEYSAQGNVTRVDYQRHNHFTLTEHKIWLHQYDDSGRLSQTEYWYDQDSFGLTRTLWKYTYDQAHRVTRQVEYNLPTAGVVLVGEWTEDELTPLRTQSFIYSSCQVQVNVDEGSDGTIEQTTLIDYPATW